MLKQNLFVLTRDMVPIWLSDFSRRGCTFICPLPKGYKKVVTERHEEIEEVSQKIVAEINKKAQVAASPFENILLGYHERTKEEQVELLRGFKIRRAHIDERGVYGVWAGGDVNSGDIYLASDVTNWYYRTLQPLAQFFEPGVAFCCHNIDWYWQALLTREFCIEYFNWLNKSLGG